MPGYEKIESLKNGGSWGQFCWKTCGFERVNLHYLPNFFAIMVPLQSSLRLSNDLFPDPHFVCCPVEMILN